MEIIVFWFCLAVVIVGESYSMVRMSERDFWRSRPLLLGLVVTFSCFVSLSCCVVIAAYLMPSKVDKVTVYALEGVALASSLIFGVAVSIGAAAAHKHNRIPR